MPCKHSWHALTHFSICIHSLIYSSYCNHSTQHNRFTRVKIRQKCWEGWHTTIWAERKIWNRLNPYLWGFIVVSHFSSDVLDGLTYEPHLILKTIYIKRKHTFIFWLIKMSEYPSKYTDCFTITYTTNNKK